MATRIEIPEGRRERFREALDKLLPFLTCDLCVTELGAHRWFVVKGPGTEDARIVRCSEHLGGEMPAEGKQNAANLGNGTRILVTRVAGSDKLLPARGKTDALIAKVEGKEVSTVSGARPRRYNIETDLGTVENVAAIQTFWLATDKQVADAKAKKPVPPAQFSAPVIPEPRAAKRTRAKVEAMPSGYNSDPDPTDDVASVTEPQPLPVQMPPGFVNGQRVHTSIPDAPTLRCVDRSGCTEQATQQVVSRPHIRYCPRHGAEFEVRQQYVIDPWELELIR